MADLQERFGATDAVTRSIVEDSCPSMGPLLRSFVENFHADLNRLLSERFRAGPVVSQFHANVAIDGITSRFLEGAVSDNGDGSTKCGDVIDPPVDPISLSCSYCFPSQPQLINTFFLVLV